MPSGETRISSSSVTPREGMWPEDRTGLGHTKGEPGSALSRPFRYKTSSCARGREYGEQHPSTSKPWFWLSEAPVRSVRWCRVPLGLGGAQPQAQAQVSHQVPLAPPSEAWLCGGVQPTPPHPWGGTPGAIGRGCTPAEGSSPGSRVTRELTSGVKSPSFLPEK